MTFLSTLKDYVLFPQEYYTSGGFYLNKSRFLILPSYKLGEKVDNWRAKIKAGSDAGSAYSRDSYRVRVKSGTYVYEYKHVSNEQWSTGTFVGSPFLPLTVSDEISEAHLLTLPPEAEAEALKKMYQKLRSERTQVNGMLVLGELRETLRMIRKPVAALQKGVREVLTTLSKTKRGLQGLSIAKRRKAIIDAASGTLLEANFGWSPLFSDIRDIAKTAVRHQIAPPRKSRLVSIGSATKSDVVSLDGTLLDVGNDLFFAASRATRKDTSASVRYVVGLNLEEKCAFGTLNSLIELSGFTLENFVPTIYELIPYSFLFDYFSNLGDLIEAGVTNTSNVAWVSRTERQKTEMTLSSQPDFPMTVLYAGAQGYAVRSGSGDYGSYTFVRTTVSRSVGLSLQTPPLVIILPFDNGRKVSNMLALLAQGRNQDRRFLRL